MELHPGKLPPEIDPSLEPPNDLPKTTPPSSQYRYDRTPIYAELTYVDFISRSYSWTYSLTKPL
jgi:hypothetical protein